MQLGIGIAASLKEWGSRKGTNCRRARNANYLLQCFLSGAFLFEPDCRFAAYRWPDVPLSRTPEQEMSQ
jgi:hypothetical protein